MAHGIWSMVEARTHFSGLLDRVQREGYQILSRNGCSVAVVVPVSEWAGGSGAILTAWRLRPLGLGLDDEEMEALFLLADHRGEAERLLAARNPRGRDARLPLDEEDTVHEISTGH